MQIFLTILVCLFASFFAGIGTGFVGMSAAVAITPILMGFLNIPHFEATAIALASDVLASAGAAIMYGRHKNVDIKNGLILLITILIFTFGGTVAAYYVPNTMMGIGTLVSITLMGLKMLIFPNTRLGRAKEGLTKRRKFVYSVLFGSIIGFVCGFCGAGGGMLLLLVLTVFLGYEMHMAVGTSVFVMSFSAFTGSAFHIMWEAIKGGKTPGLGMFESENFFNILILCVAFTLIFSLLGSKFANRMSEKTLNIFSGAMLLVIAVIVGVMMIVFPEGVTA